MSLITNQLCFTCYSVKPELLTSQNLLWPWHVIHVILTTVNRLQLSKGYHHAKFQRPQLHNLQKKHPKKHKKTLEIYSFGHGEAAERANERRYTLSHFFMHIRINWKENCSLLTQCDIVSHHWHWSRTRRWTASDGSGVCLQPLLPPPLSGPPHTEHCTWAEQRSVTCEQLTETVSLFSFKFNALPYG